jgi:hypothetical protein
VPAPVGEMRSPDSPNGRPAGLHLVDIENLAGPALPTLGQVRDEQDRYADRLAFGGLDHVVIASSHLTLLNAALGWPHDRCRVRSGPDGADLELLDVLHGENVASRFTHVVIGSGDGLFARAARQPGCRRRAGDRGEPVPLEYSIAWLTCAFASSQDAVMVGWPGATQDRLPASPPDIRPRCPSAPQGLGEGC